MVKFVACGKLFGLVDDEQRVVAPFVFDSVEPFVGGYGVGSINWFGDYLYDESGKLALGQPFEKITRNGFSQEEDSACNRDAHYVIRHKNETCVLGRGLEVLVPWGEYNIESGPSEGIWMIRDSCCRYGFAGMGRVISPCMFDNACSFSNGYAAVKCRDGKWGMIDARGELVIPAIYDGIDYTCSEGVVGASKDGLAGFLDLSGHVIIPFAFKSVDVFRHGTASVVTTGGISREIDHSGRFVDVVNEWEIPEALCSKCIDPAKAREIADRRKKQRQWFNGLEGREFSTLREVEVGYLVHYMAPYTGAGSESIPKDVVFTLRSKMRNDAWYCDIKGDSIVESVCQKERAKANQRPRLARRFAGISFFLTEGQLADGDFMEVVSRG